MFELPLLKLTFHALSELLALGDPDQTTEIVSEVHRGEHILAVAFPGLYAGLATGPTDAQ